MSQGGSLDGKAALVTGGTRGIGAAIVRRLAAEGAAVAFTYASSVAAGAALVQEIEGRGGRALALQADSAEPSQIKGAVAATVEGFGRLDILVNNAGQMWHGPIEAVSVAELDRMYAVNIRAPLLATQAAAPHLGDGGRVIMIGSIVADRLGAPGGSIYGMSKGAVAALVRGLAHDLAPRGVTVTNVQPGPTDTDMAPAAFHEMLKARIPRRQIGRPEEIANVVAFLASDQSSYVNGASITVDGGYNI